MEKSLSNGGAVADPRSAVHFGGRAAVVPENLDMEHNNSLAKPRFALSSALCGAPSQPVMNAHSHRSAAPAAPVPGATRIASARPLPLWSIGFLLAGLLVTAPVLAPRAHAAESDRSTPPRANLMPAAPSDIPRIVPPLPVKVNAPADRTNESVAAIQPQTSMAGGGKIIEMSAPTPANAQAAVGGMKKVIDVPGLTLPPLSAPLPTWMRSAAVRVDKLEKTGLPTLPAPPPVRAVNKAATSSQPSQSTAANKTRLAQNPAAPPVRNPPAPVTSSDRLPNQIEVAVSTFVVLLTTTDLQTVAVADPAIADVAIVNSRSVLLNGKGPGVTSLVIVDGQKIRQYTVRVTSAPGERPVDVAEAIGIPGVSVRQVKDAVVLEGEVASDEEAKRAAEIAGIYATKVVNQLKVRGDENAVDAGTATAAQISDLIGLPGVVVRMAGTTVILSGQVETAAQAADAQTIAETMAPKVLNLLKTPPMSVDDVRRSLGAQADGTVAPLAGPGQIQLASPLVVRELAGQLILEGNVQSESEAQRIISEANRTGLTVSNRLNILPALSATQQLASSVAQAINLPGVRVSGSANRLILQGIVQNTNDAVVAEQIARSFAPQVDNLLQTPNPILVDVDISIVEISNNVLKNLGFQFPSLQDASQTGFVIGQRSLQADLPGALVGQRAGATAPNFPTNTLDRAVGTQSAFQAALRAEARDNNVRLLSNPRTTVLSGRTATFQVGGQVPVPVSITQTATGTVTGIQFKDFGVLVDVVPNASLDGNVTMRLRTEVSQPDPTIGFQPVAGAGIIPGFTRRATVSEVTIARGGTIALGGLISTDNRKLISKVPVLGDIPILGKLFQSKRFQNLQTELVIFVTPRVLPNPLAPGETSFAGVVAVGNNSNSGTVLGNPGIPQFNGGGVVAGATQ